MQDTSNRTLDLYTVSVYYFRILLSPYFRLISVLFRFRLLFQSIFAVYSVHSFRIISAYYLPIIFHHHPRFIPQLRYQKNKSKRKTRTPGRHYARCVHRTAHCPANDETDLRLWDPLGGPQKKNHRELERKKQRKKTERKLKKEREVRQIPAAAAYAPVLPPSQNKNPYLG